MTTWPPLVPGPMHGLLPGCWQYSDETAVHHAVDVMTSPNCCMRETICASSSAHVIVTIFGFCRTRPPL